jgi:hypothetical protein
MKAGPLPPDAHAREGLERKVASLAIPTQAGRPSSPRAASWAGRTYTLPANDDKVESVRLEAAADGPPTLVIKVDGRESRLQSGQGGSWRRAGSVPVNKVDQAAAVSGAWTADDTYTARISLYETPYRITLGLRFVEDRLFFDFEYNVGFGNAPTKRPQLVARAEPRGEAAASSR